MAFITVSTRSGCRGLGGLGGHTFTPEIRRRGNSSSKCRKGHCTRPLTQSLVGKILQYEYHHPLLHKSLAPSSPRIHHCPVPFLRLIQLRPPNSFKSSPPPPPTPSIPTVPSNTPSYHKTIRVIMSSPSSWQDRRFMFPAGREVHQGSRRYSGSKGSDTDSNTTLSPTTSNTAPPPPAPTPIAEEPPTTSSIVHPPWEGDRRFMFPAAKEVHQPAVRRGSGSQSSADKSAAANAAASPTRTSGSPPTSSGGGIAAALAGRRRVRA